MIFAGDSVMYELAEITCRMLGTNYTAIYTRHHGGQAPQYSQRDKILDLANPDRYAVRDWFRDSAAKSPGRNLLIFNIGIYRRMQEMDLDRFRQYVDDMHESILQVLPKGGGGNRGFHSWPPAQRPIVFAYLPPSIHGFRGPFLTQHNIAHYSQVLLEKISHWDDHQLFKVYRRCYTAN